MGKIPFLKYSVFLFSSVIFTFLVLVSIPRNELVVDNQPKGEALHIKKVSLTKGGFIVVTASDVNTNLPDETSFLNIPLYLPPGIYRNIDVKLNEVAILDMTRVGVTLYEDTSREPGSFDVIPEDPGASDTPALSLFGKVVRRIINVY